MPRPAQYDSAIGEQIDRARRDGVPWKVLCDEFGLCRTRLHQLWREWKQAQAAEEKCS